MEEGVEVGLSSEDSLYRSKSFDGVGLVATGMR